MRKGRAGPAGTLADKTELNLGERVRRLRTERRLSVRTLAARAQFSPSFVSQVELNQASPSIASLGRLASALGVTLGDLFQDPSTAVSALMRARRRRRLTSWWSRARIEALTPVGARRRFEAVLITMSAGGSSGKRPHTEAGDHLAFVVGGRVRLTLGQGGHLLSAGDAITFNDETPHLWENPGRKPARLLLVSARFMA